MHWAGELAKGVAYSVVVFGLVRVLERPLVDHDTFHQNNLRSAALSVFAVMIWMLFIPYTTWVFMVPVAVLLILLSSRFREIVVYFNRLTSEE